MQLLFKEDDAVIGFFVSSDYDRNKGLLEVSIEDWMQYMDLIISDDVVEREMCFDEAKDDYRIIKKERG